MSSLIEKVAKRDTDHARVSLRFQVVRSLALAAVLGGAGPQVALAQGAGMLRPSQIAPGSRELEVTPALAGFRLGEPSEPAQARLGTPVTIDTLGSGPDAVVSLMNDSTGINLFVSRSQGVGVIMVTRGDAGALDGIRVGDSRAKVVARWGPPAAGGARAGLWSAGTALISAALDDRERVTRLGIGVAFDGAGQ